MNYSTGGGGDHTGTASIALEVTSERSLWGLQGQGHPHQSTPRGMGCSKQVPSPEQNKTYPGWTNTHKHLQKFRSADSDEGNIGFSSCGLS